MKIVPSILSDTYEDFLLRLRQAEGLTDYVQIDIMDGRFVSTKSFPAELIGGAKTDLTFEVHLMVESPEALACRIRHPGLKKVIYHFEAVDEHDDMLQELRNEGIEAGLAVKPETTMDEFRGVAEHVGTLLFLTVDPGKYGSPFRPEVLTKVAEARKAFGGKTIGVDGGVSLGNLHSFLDIGVDYVCVGSRIFLHGRPEDNYRNFTERVRLLERGKPSP
jgi:ribulose-phosphate 3-epimerase